MSIKKIAIVLLFLFSLSVSSSFAEGEINISPIVQIISYGDIYWKYPQMMWWWSASIINKEWVIISNDHVVDDWKWALSSAFSVCITKELSKKPICNYTASLISRDDKLDISILKIDNKDIYWNTVDYSKFKTIDIDFNYEPKNQDDVIAIWYPWIWADTISETKWIVSWISEYNGYKYIKTDTLIAWWNSGWAFIKNWKLIWIPTFWIGWWDSMWYALDIREAKSFIEENINKPSVKSPITSLIDFNSYRMIIENINNSLKLSDDIFDVILPSDYQISNYIKNISLDIELKKQKDIWVNYLSLYLEKAPKIINEKQKLYYFETKWLYNKEWQKLIKKNINWIDYYSPIDKNDLSNWNSNWSNSYFAIENWYLIMINIQAPFYDEKRNKEVKEEVEKLLSSIKINLDNFSKIKTEFSTNVPKIDIKSNNNSIVDTWKYKIYLWNLYEHFEVYLNELVEYNGKWKTAQEIYDVQLKDIDKSLKSMIKFNWLDWFIYCGSVKDYYYYNYYDYYWYNKIPVDENGNPIDIETCEINLFFPINDELNRQNYLSLKLSSLKNNKAKNLNIAIEFLKKHLKVEWVSNQIDIPNILKNQLSLKFMDISNQTREYKNFLKLLVRYKMIENTNTFNWNTPIKWWEYLYLYTKYVYNYSTLDNAKCDKKDYKCMFTKFNVWDKSLDSIFSWLWIVDYNEYIDGSKYGEFDIILNYKLAWVDFWNLTFDNFFTFQHLIDEEQNIPNKEKLNNFDNLIYWNKKILISDFYSNYNTYYFFNKVPRFYPKLNKILYDNNRFSNKINFGSKINAFDLEFAELYKSSQCYLKSTYNEGLLCNKKYDEKYIELQAKYLDNKDLVWLDLEYYYTPLTKAQAIENIFTKVDFWLFDKKLAENKWKLDYDNKEINIK